MPEGLDSKLLHNAAWLSSKQALIDLDRAMVERFGLRAFVELAWHVIEPTAVFVPNWHIDEICRELEDVMAGRNRRLAIACPPRHSKSTILSVMFPAYYWIKDASQRMMFISYDFSLAIRDSKRTRDLVSSEWFQDRWGAKVQLKTDNSIILETTKTGYRECISVGGRVMGKGANVILADDPHDIKDVESDVKRTEVLNFWRERVQSRLNDPKTGVFIVCHQRVGENDVIGDILKRQPGEYRYMSLPVYFDPKHPHLWPGDPRTETGELLWPAHMPRGVIERFSNNLGSYAFNSQFQQLPGPREGGLFKTAWFPRCKLHELPADLEFCRGWDFAATVKSLIKADPDWTATVKIGHSRITQKYYIVDVQRWRVDGGEVDRIMRTIATVDGYATRIRYPQDPGAAGKTRAEQQGGNLSGFSFVCEPVTGDKAVNAAPVASQAMIGNVVILDADWTDMFLAELAGFPTAAHDDMVDAAAQAFKGFIRSNTGILDYYSRLLDQDKLAKEAAESKPKDGVTHEQTDDLARAFKTGGMSN
jgi:predicted phage terminase large subunit-like protein